MSYQVLARKWRPANFSQVAGQSHVLKSLINALDNQRLHHAYLFAGTRGVGKTTLARILAKCLNCEAGVSSRPCEECSACTEISEGRFIDLIEVDAASRTKVEDTRELLENVQYTPGRGRYKVYLIDEVHMLSNHSFNALLKTLEEPPPHVKFLFATTDPQKLPVTILSRCLQFNLKNLSPKVIVDYLQTVLQEEKIEHDEDALWQIAAAATGSMRDALTLVDQAISYCQGSVVKTGVVEMLGVPEQQQVYALLSAMADGDMGEVLKLVNLLSDQAPDYSHTLDSLLSCLHRLAIAQVAPDAIDNSFGDKAQIRELAQKFSGEDIQLFYQIGSKGRSDLRSGIDIRSAFEMLLIRMMVFSPTLVDQNLGRGQNESEVLEKGEPLKKKRELIPASTEKQQIVSSRQDVVDSPVSDSAPAPDPPNVNPPAAAGEYAMASEGIAENSPLGSSEDKHSSTSSGAAPIAGDEAGGIPENLDHAAWLALFPTLPVTGIAANVLANTRLHSVETDKFFFILDSLQSAVYREELLPKLNQVLTDFFGRSIAVSIEIGEVEEETPARRAARVRNEEQTEMIRQFEQDDNVQQLVKRFSASVAPNSITPVKDQR